MFGWQIAVIQKFKFSVGVNPCVCPFLYVVFIRG